MCGIAGIVNAGDRRALEAMTASLAHRGPDDEGYYADSSIALGHRRLSIIDLESGSQPISNEAGNLQLVCNGEIYNSPRLRSELVSAGHVFKTKTDVEVILHLYEDHGTDCVRHLRGMFAFALWDADSRTLLLARDHLGQKPLFFHESEEGFLFASEVKALLSSGRVSPTVDLDALWHYVSLRFIPDDRTLFNGIRKLPAASWLLWRNGTCTTQKYWSPSFRKKISGNEAEVVERLNACLLESVDKHMLSDVPVGAFLSGGLDSSTVAAMMAMRSPESVPTFSIGVREQGFNELPYARMVTDRYGMDAHEEVVSANLIHLIPKMIHHLDEPSDPFGVGVFLAAQLASNSVKVVLTGDGGDENFAGYDRFAGQRFADYYCVLPEWLRKTVMRSVIRRIPESFAYKSLAQKAAWLNEMSFYSRGMRYAHSVSFLRFSFESKEQLFTEQARASLVDPNSAQKILSHFEADNAEELVDRMLYTDLMTRMPEHLLLTVDRMCMAHSLESRSPLVDHRVVEFAASIPSRMKLKGRNLKYLLKKVAARYLPRELVFREKQGFSFPLGSWMRTDLRGFIRNLFLESRFVEEGIFEREEVDRLRREHVEGIADHNYRLWILINLELWYRCYFEGETVDSMRELTERLTAG